jgi:hypothetical protein
MRVCWKSGKFMAMPPLAAGDNFVELEHQGE